MYCPNCGEKIKDPNQKFCQYCGAALKFDTETSISQADIISNKSATIPSTEYTPTDAKQKTSKKHSKRCFAGAMISFTLSLLTIIIGLPLIFFIGSSIHLEEDPLSIFYFYYFLLYYPFSGYYPTPRYVLDEGLRMIAHVYGVLFILFGIASFILGIVARRTRRKAIYRESNNGLVKAGGVLAILGIIQGIIGAIIGGILFYLPFYATLLNYVSGI